MVPFQPDKVPNYKVYVIQHSQEVSITQPAIIADDEKAVVKTEASETLSKKDLKVIKDKEIIRNIIYSSIDRSRQVTEFKDWWLDCRKALKQKKIDPDSEMVQELLQGAIDSQSSD